MTTGRKPQPTNLKILRGNPGKRPINRRVPKPVADAPHCPAFIAGIAREQWDSVGPELHRLGVMTTLDALALALLANSVARWIAAEAQVKKHGEVLKGKDGGLYQSPYLSVANKAWEQTVKLLAEFGMTPSSRSRIVTVSKDTGSDFEKDIARHA